MTQITRHKYVIGHNHGRSKEFYVDIPAKHIKGHDSIEHWQLQVKEKGSSWRYYDRDTFFGYRWNTFGHRNDYEFNSWGDKPWILALGDSNVEGTGNRRIDLFHEVIAKEKGLVNYNAGIGGTSNHSSIWNGFTLLNLAKTKPEFVLLRLTDVRRYSNINQLGKGFKLKDMNKKGTMSYETDGVITARIDKGEVVSEVTENKHGGYMFHLGAWTTEEPWLGLLLDRDEHKIAKSEARLMFLMFQQFCSVNNIPLILLTATGQTSADNWEKYAKVPGVIEVEECQESDPKWHELEKARDDMHFGPDHHFKIAKRVLEAI